MYCLKCWKTLPDYWCHFWNNKIPNVKPETIIANIEEGDIFEIHKINLKMLGLNAYGLKMLLNGNI